MNWRRRVSKSGLGPGSMLGSYLIEELLGEGGTGSVFRAVERDRGQVVALKVMKPTLASDDQYTRRFLHEARAASELEHEHLVPLLDFGFAHGRPYLAMRYVVGRSLGERIDAEGPLPIGEAVRIAGQVGRALDALHARGLVHRDVKPANIMLDQAGTASLTDFGLAKGDGYSTVTKPGQIVGTLDYLAPELIKGEPAGPMSDLYALGCVVIECLCGRPPFAGKRVFEVGTSVLQDEPPDPCAQRRDASPEFSQSVRVALAKDPSARPATCVTYGGLLATLLRSPATEESG